MRCQSAVVSVFAVAILAGCSDSVLQQMPTAPSVGLPASLNHESGGANAVVFITEDGLQPRRLEVSGRTITFVNQTSVPRWIRSDPHAPDGHNECLEFEAIGILQPGQSGALTLVNTRCKYHEHLMLANLTSEFRGEVRFRER